MRTFPRLGLLSAVVIAVLAVHRVITRAVRDRAREHGPSLGRLRAEDDFHAGMSDGSSMFPPHRPAPRVLVTNGDAHPVSVRPSLSSTTAASTSASTKGTSAKKTSAKETSVKKSSARKAPARKSPEKKTPAKKSPAKKAAARKPSTGR